MSPSATGAIEQRVGGWHRDPHGRFEHRWHDGQIWTDAVATNGVPSFERTEPSEPPPTATPPERDGGQGDVAQGGGVQGGGVQGWRRQGDGRQGDGAPGGGVQIRAGLIVAGIVIVGGLLAAMMAPVSDETPGSPERSSVTSAPLTAEAAQTSATIAWDSRSPEDREEACAVWMVSPDYARNVFLADAGVGNEAFWPPFEEILRTEC